MFLFSVLDLKTPCTLDRSGWIDRLAYMYFTGKRRKILNEVAPEVLSGYLRRIQEVEGLGSHLRSREAVEIQLTDDVLRVAGKIDSSK